MAEKWYVPCITPTIKPLNLRPPSSSSAIFDPARLTLKARSQDSGKAIVGGIGLRYTQIAILYSARIGIMRTQ